MDSCDHRSILEKRNTGPWIMRVTFIRRTVTLPCRARRLRLSRSLGPRRRDTEVRTTSRRERSSFSAHLLSDLAGRSLPRGEREGEKERSRRKISSRIGKIQGTSDSVRGQNRLEMRAKASMPSRVTAGVPQVGHVQSRPPHERAREPISPFPSSVCLVSTIARVRWP